MGKLSFDTEIRHKSKTYLSHRNQKYSMYSRSNDCTWGVPGLNRPYRVRSFVGWLIVPYLRRHLTHKITGIVHYGLLGIILGWSALPPYTIHRVPGRVRIVYRNGRRFHFQGCCIQICAPFKKQPHYVRRSIRRGAGDLWSYNDPAWTHSRRRLH